MSSIGTLALGMALLFMGVASFAALVGKAHGHERLLLLSRRAVNTVAFLLTLAVVCLLYLIFTDDFLVRMVQTSSSRSLDWYFKLTLLWVDLESSILFWAWILALLAAAAVHVHRRALPELIPHATVVLMVILAFFVYLLLFHKNPFDEYLVEKPVVGNGMRLMLRNPWMLVHPPAQYLGYICTTIPFAFGLAALLRPREQQDDVSWVQAIRPWVMTAWLFLGVGLVLGMIWAYELLDWGGWWSWDPVENAALIPWFTATGLVHSVVILGKRRLLKGWTLFLILTTFWLTILGTFMTRSGIVRSVHSFGKDEALVWAFLIFMGAGMAISFGLLLARLTAGSRSEQRHIGSFLSLEFLFVLANWVFFLSAIFVLMATLYPTLSEWLIGKRVSIGGPFYEKYMGPLGLVLLFLTALAPVVPWHGITVRRLAELMFWPVASLLVTAILMSLAWPKLFVLHRWVSVIGLEFPIPWMTSTQLCVGLCVMLMTAIFVDYGRVVRARVKRQGESVLLALGRTFALGRLRYGAQIVHLGVALMYLGFAGRGYVSHIDQIVMPGDTIKLAGYEFTYRGLTQSRGREAESLQAMVLVKRPADSESSALLPIQKWYYEDPRQPMSDVDLIRGFTRDLHLRMVWRPGSGDQLTLKIAVHPIVSWIWLGFLLMVIGALICLVPRQTRRSAEKTPEAARAPPRSGLLASASAKVVAGVTAAAILAAIAVYLARISGLGLERGVWTWGLGLAVVAVAAYMLRTAAALVPGGAAELAMVGATATAARANGGGAALAARRKEWLIHELRELERSRQARGISVAQHDKLAAHARWELAQILADEDAESRREELRQFVRSGGGSPVPPTTVPDQEVDPS